MVRKNFLVFRGKTFKLQSNFEYFVKRIIRGIGCCADVKHMYPEQHDILLEVLQRHPKYAQKAVNMCNLKIAQNKLNHRGLEIILVKSNGSEEDISYKKAIAGKASSKQTELKSAMRSSIEDQILEFQRTNEQKCALCSATKRIQVDHVVHFDELACLFLEDKIRRGEPIPSAFDDMTDGTHRKCFRAADAEFETEWTRHHAATAELRMLCVHCNVRRTRSVAVTGTRRWAGVMAAIDA